MDAAKTKVNGKFRRSFGACRSCKKDRKKCDEARPACARCRVTRRACAYEPRPCRIFEGTTQTVDLSVCTNATPLGQPLQLDVEHVALQLFLDLHAEVQRCAGPETMPGPTSTLFALRKAPDLSPLQLAGRAFSLLLLATSRKDAAMRNRATTAFHASIVGFQRQLTAAQHGTSLDALATAQLLLCYDVISPDTNVVDPSIHILGLQSLLKALPQTTSTSGATAEERQLIATTKSYLLRSHHWRGLHISAETADLVCSGLPVVPGGGELYALEPVLIEAYNWWTRQRRRSLARETSKAQESLQRFTHRGQSLLNSLLGWECLLADHWAADITLTRAPAPADGPPRTMRSFTHPNAAEQLLDFYICKLYVAAGVVECLVEVRAAPKGWGNADGNPLPLPRALLDRHLQSCYQASVDAVDFVGSTLYYFMGADAAPLYPNISPAARRRLFKDQGPDGCSPILLWAYVLCVLRGGVLTAGQAAWFREAGLLIHSRNKLPPVELIESLFESCVERGARLLRAMLQVQGDDEKVVC